MAARVAISSAHERRETAATDASRSRPPERDRRAGSWLFGATMGLGLKLALASALAVSLLIGAGALFAYHGEKQQLLRAMREAASTQGRLVLTGLKSAMLQNNPVC